jgi:dihydroxy-acid dehydratase
MIDIDIPNRSISLRVDDAEIAVRRKAQEAIGFKPVEIRKRNITNALKAYAAMTTSAAKGAVRRVLD